MFSDFENQKDRLSRWRRREGRTRSVGGPSGATLLGYGFYPKTGQNQADFCFSDRLSVVYLLEGEGVYSDEHTGRIALKAGDLVFRIPNRPHQTLTAKDSPWLEFYIDLPPATVDLLAQTGIDVSTKPVWSAGLDGRLMLRIEEIRRKFSLEEHTSPVHLLLALQSFLLEGIELARAAASGHFGTTMQRLCREMAQGLHWGRSMPDIATGAGLDYDVFRRLFKAHTGESPATYLNRMRIDEARSLLLQSTLSVTAIAEYLEYTSVYVFSRAFKQATGLSPQAYRLMT
ncbi:MAG: helix-turn-helix domain-containing protein [Verrucomicrobia bacterium]|nr:helix-turn-helix domain-containing protein [Verrucomicrobiota bacterium]MCH8528660.1 helix-turn-helix domain-containing protein [Kiritimatiellia bacterium]